MRKNQKKAKHIIEETCSITCSNNNNPLTAMQIGKNVWTGYSFLAISIWPVQHVGSIVIWDIHLSNIITSLIVKNDKLCFRCITSQ